MLKNELLEAFNKELQETNYKLVAVKLDGFSHMAVFIHEGLSNPKQSEAVVVSYSHYTSFDYPDKTRKMLSELSARVLKSYPHYSYKGNARAFYFIYLPK